MFIKPLEVSEKELKEVNSIKLPKNISDRWGYVSEGTNQNSLNGNEEKTVVEKGDLLNKKIAIASLQKYLDFTKKVG